MLTLTILTTIIAALAVSMAAICLTEDLKSCEASAEGREAPRNS